MRGHRGIWDHVEELKVTLRDLEDMKRFGVTQILGVTDRLRGREVFGGIRLRRA